MKKFKFEISGATISVVVDADVETAADARMLLLEQLEFVTDEISYSDFCDVLLDCIISRGEEVK